MSYPPYRLAAKLDPLLGDPHDRGGLFSFAACAGLDEREDFPTEICRWLDELGLPAYYVPARLGGAANTFEETLQVIRLLARRDLGVAISHAKTFLGAASTWVAADAGQAGWLARQILRGSVVAWGLTEEMHGSDLLACDTTAVPAAGGYRLDGAKWLINNATRADVVCVFARTDPAGGPRGFSLFLVEKRTLAPGSFTCIPRARTHGMRDAEISGITFHGAEVPAGARLGPAGAGLEIVVKTLQLTKIVTAAPLSLGAGDHALRTALELTAPGGTGRPDPVSARALAGCYADQLVAEVVATVAARSVHALTAELSVVAAAVKYFLPTSVDQMIISLGTVLGPAALLMDNTFQKTERDHRVVGIFDGNTLVNLNAIINQFPVLARGYRTGQVDRDGLAGVANLSGPLPEFDGRRLSLVARGGCSLVQSLPDAVDEVQQLAAGGVVPSGLAACAGTLLELTEDLHARLAAHRPAALDVPVAAFTMARRYVLCFAAAACLQVYLANRSEPDARADPLWAGGLWLEACLRRVVHRLRPVADRDDEVPTRLGEVMATQFRDQMLFSPFPCQLVREAR